MLRHLVMTVFVSLEFSPDLKLHWSFSSNLWKHFHATLSFPELCGCNSSHLLRVRHRDGRETCTRAGCSGTVTAGALLHKYLHVQNINDNFHSEATYELSMNPVSVLSRKRVARVDGRFGIIILAVVAIAVWATPDGKTSPEEAWLTLQQSSASCRHCF